MGLFLLQPLQTHGTNDVPDGSVPVGPVPDAGGDVLGRGHVGEQGVLLEQVAHLPFLGRQIDLCSAVEQGHTVQHDLALVRSQNPCDAPQCHGFAAAGGSQQGQTFVFRFKPDFQLKVSHFLTNIHGKGHQRPPPFPVCRWRVSSRFTASRNTAEMAMFTSTHFNAPRSSLVRQSW